MLKHFLEHWVHKQTLYEVLKRISMTCCNEQVAANNWVSALLSLHSPPYGHCVCWSSHFESFAFRGLFWKYFPYRHSPSPSDGATNPKAWNVPGMWWHCSAMFLSVSPSQTDIPAGGAADTQPYPSMHPSIPIHPPFPMLRVLHWEKTGGCSWLWPGHMARFVAASQDKLWRLFQPRKAKPKKLGRQCVWDAISGQSELQHLIQGSFEGCTVCIRAQRSCAGD